MIIDGVGWVLIVSAAILLVALGGLASSLLNHLRLTSIEAKLEHAARNHKMVREALERREAKIDTELKSREAKMDARNGLS